LFGRVKNIMKNTIKYTNKKLNKKRKVVRGFGDLTLNEFHLGENSNELDHFPTHPL